MFIIPAFFRPLPRYAVGDIVEVYPESGSSSPRHFRIRTRRWTIPPGSLEKEWQYRGHFGELVGEYFEPASSDSIVLQSLITRVIRKTSKTAR